jgi:hypothetical protein
LGARIAYTMKNTTANTKKEWKIQDNAEGDILNVLKIFKIN